MKILAINRTLEQSVADAIKHLAIIPDSAIIREGKPFFIPGFSQQWKYQASIAFRVNRLGKNIATKFTHRYIDALTLAVRTIPVDFEAAVAPSAIASAFDGAFIIGDWIELDQFENVKTLLVEIGDQQLSIDISQLAIEETIASLSKYLTLKIGDIIAPTALPLCNDITINTIIDGKLNNSPIIRLKFK